MALEDIDKLLGLDDSAKNSEQPPASESVASPDKRPDVEFSVREPEALVEYLRGLAVAAVAGEEGVQGTIHNITIRFTCPPRATPALALEELAGLMTRAGDVLRGELAAAAAAAAKDGGQKHHQTHAIQPLAYRNRRPTPAAAAPKTTTDAAHTPP